MGLVTVNYWGSSQGVDDFYFFLAFFHTWEDVSEMQIEAARISSDEEVKANGVANNNSSERPLPGDCPRLAGLC